MTRMAVTFLIPGNIAAELCLLSTSLSLWGGYDPHTGKITDMTHPQCGLVLSERVLAMREARGSSSSSSALVESARCGTAPSAIILERLDPILVIGAMIAAELYEIIIPVLLLRPDLWQVLRSGMLLRTHAATSELEIID